MISVLIPTCEVHPDIARVEQALSGYEFEVIVEYDEWKGGKGLTLRKALMKAKGDLIVWLDSDFQIEPWHVKYFVRMLEKTNADVVIGSRKLPWSIARRNLTRSIVSTVSSWLIRILFRLPFSDTQAGIKLFKRAVLAGNGQVNGFGYDIEVLYKIYHQKHKILELPILVKESKESTVNLKSIFKTLKEVLWLRSQL